MKISKTAIFTGLVMLATASGAIAFGGQGGGHMNPPEFSEIDTNGDGLVTLEELQGLKEVRFTQTDTDGNGEITAEEMMAARDNAKSERIAKRIEKLDTDGSGGISLEEMSAHEKFGNRAERMIEKIDTDGDGSISEEEFAAAKEKMGRKAHKHKGDNNDA